MEEIGIMVVIAGVVAVVAQLRGRMIAVAKGVGEPGYNVASALGSGGKTIAVGAIKRESHGTQPPEEAPEPPKQPRGRPPRGSVAHQLKPKRGSTSEARQGSAGSAVQTFSAYVKSGTERAFRSRKFAVGPGVARSVAGRE